MSDQKELIVVFDGSFEGLLTIVFDCYKQDLIQIVETKNLQESFFFDYLFIESDFEKAKRVRDSLSTNSSDKNLTDAFIAFNTADDSRFLSIFKYIKFAFRMGTNIDYYWQVDEVSKVNKLCRYYYNELQLLYGTLRFKKTADNIFYAKISPVNNVLYDLALFFKDRLGTENWLIHDKNRDIAAAFNRKEILIYEVPKDTAFRLADDECDYEALWFQFFNSIAIKERINKKLQRSNMPLRYQKNAIEFESLYFTTMAKLRKQAEQKLIE